MCLNPYYCHDGKHEFRKDERGNMVCVRTDFPWLSKYPHLSKLVLPCGEIDDPVACTCFDPDWTKYVGCQQHSPEGAKEPYPTRQQRGRGQWEQAMRRYVSKNNPDYDGMDL